MTVYQSQSLYGLEVNSEEFELGSSQFEIKGISEILKMIHEDFTDTR